jgi:murein DD-endopeptidase MepM/ murein hydrolase activator NlpD
LVRKQVFDPLRYPPADDSIHFHKDHSRWSVVGEAIVVILFTLLGLLLIAVAILEPSGLARAQETSQAAVVNPGISASKPQIQTAVDRVLDHEPGLLIGEALLSHQPSVPTLWPVNGKLTDGFGSRRNPFRKRSSEFHTGQDIAAPWGTPVAATADGTVEFAGRMSGYGQVVVVDHGDGVHTRYGHLSRIDVRIGQLLRGGDQVGRVGLTGRSTGPHLHYEVRIGEEPVNPMAYLSFVR